MIPRTEYLDSLTHLRDKQIIKVVTGIRRCGKSTLPELFQEQLLQDGVAYYQFGNGKALPISIPPPFWNRFLQPDTVFCLTVCCLSYRQAVHECLVF